MSAFIVNNEHIHALVTAAKQSRDFRFYYKENLYYVNDLKECDFIGQMLLNENYRSVNFRYSEEIKAPNYEFEYSIGFSPIEIIKACHCFNYQSCETDDYYDSLSYKFIKTLIETMIMILPGYNNADWEIINKKTNAIPFI